MKRNVAKFEDLYNGVSNLRTKNADINSDVKSVLDNLNIVKNSTIIPDSVKDNYYRIVKRYIEGVTDLKANSDSKRPTRMPYDKTLETFFLIVYDATTDNELLNAIIEPMRDIMALHSVKKVPIEVMLVLMFLIEELTKNANDYLGYSTLFSRGNISAEESLAADTNTDNRVQLLEDITLVADTFIDLRLYKKL